MLHADRLRLLLVCGVLLSHICTTLGFPSPQMRGHPSWRAKSGLRSVFQCARTRRTRSSCAGAPTSEGPEARVMAWCTAEKRPDVPLMNLLTRRGQEAPRHSSERNQRSVAF